MARRLEKQEAIQMRLAGATYSEIRSRYSVSKSTLSLWLREYPLSKARLREVRDISPARIERFRATMALKRSARLEQVKGLARTRIGGLTEREVLIAGYFLYWGEGWKTSSTRVALSNTDAAMLVFFIRWLEMLGVPRTKVKVQLHLYSDMNIERESQYWKKQLLLPDSCFRSPRVKNTTRAGLTYKNGFGHGTCDIIVDSRDASEMVLAGYEEIRSRFIAQAEEI